MLDDLCIRRRGSHPIGRPLNGETPTIDLVVRYHKLKHPQFLRTFFSKMARTNEQAKRTHIFGRAKLNSQTLVVICILFDYC